MSYFDFHPIVIPPNGNSLSGIRSIFVGLPLTKQKHKKKSIGFGLCRWNTQTPPCSLFTGLPRFFLRWYSSHDFTSTRFPFQSKSAASPLKGKCVAVNNSAPSSSHLKPLPVSLVQKRESLFPNAWLGVVRRYQACWTHFLEQYFLRAMPSLQCKHFI